MKQDNIPLFAFGALEKQSGRSTYRPLDRKQDTRAHKNHGLEGQHSKAIQVHVLSTVAPINPHPS